MEIIMDIPKGKHWIQYATRKNKGSLRRSLGAKKGQPIPAAKLAKAAHSTNPKLRRRAQLAQTLRRMHK